MAAYDRFGIATYESPFAPCGGVAAVMRFLPAALRQALTQPVAVFTPLHHRMPQARLLGELEWCGSFALQLDVRQTIVNLRRRREAGVDWYFIQPDTPTVFAGSPDPYHVDSLVRDALLFGTAVAKAIWLLAPSERWALHLIDWQASTVALALASEGKVPTHRLQLALHNSYDSPVAYHELARVGLRGSDCPPWGDPAASTILRRALPLVSPRVCTVSKQFARDLVTEPLHTQVLAPHLQAPLHGRLSGVDDGVFGTLAFDPLWLDANRATAPTELLAWKATRWDAVLAALEGLRDTPTTPVWGQPALFAAAARRDGGVRFLMGGRDDPQQKGYDVAAAAVRFLLTEGDAAERKAQFIFLPMPGLEGFPQLAYLQLLAAEFPDHVLALPFRFPAFAELQAGALYGLMPSIYEPFGGANEFYLTGTATIARATGGLAQQISPAKLGRAVPAPVLARSAEWHAKGAPATGFLFREADELSADGAQWRWLRETRYRPGQPGGRGEVPLFNGMAEALVPALQAAIKLYRKQPATYAKMVLDGARHILAEFTWERTAAEYLAALESD